MKVERQHNAEPYRLNTGTWTDSGGSGSPELRVSRPSPQKFPADPAPHGRVEKLHSNNGAGIEINYVEKPPEISISIHILQACPPPKYAPFFFSLRPITQSPYSAELGFEFVVTLATLVIFL